MADVLRYVSSPCDGPRDEAIAEDGRCNLGVGTAEEGRSAEAGLEVTAEVQREEAPERDVWPPVAVEAVRGRRYSFGVWGLEDELGSGQVEVRGDSDIPASLRATRGVTICRVSKSFSRSRADGSCACAWCGEPPAAPPARGAAAGAPAVLSPSSSRTLR